MDGCSLLVVFNPPAFGCLSGCCVGMGMDMVWIWVWVWVWVWVWAVSWLTLSFFYSSS